MPHLGKENGYSMCTASPSLSSVISGVQSFMWTYFKSMFPSNFFASTYVNTSLNSNSLKDMKERKKGFPHLSMNTQFELGDGFMSGLPMWHKTDRFVMKNLKRNYRLIFEDDTRGIRIYTVPQRYKIVFNYGILLQTEMSAWNVLNHINQTFENGGYNYANEIRIPTKLPEIFIVNICKKLGLDINNNKDRMQLNDYMMTNGLGPITNKKDLSTGKEKYTYDYTTNILLNYPDLTNYEKEVTNLINKSASVRYAISAELWVPGSYILEIEDDFNIQREIDSLSDDVLQFDIAILQDMIPKENERGMKLLLERNFNTEMNVKFDSTQIEEILDKDVINSIKELNKINGDIQKIVEFKLFKNNKPMSKDEYFVDYDTFELIVKEPEDNKVHTLVMYADTRKINMINELINQGRKKDLYKMDIF
ncbi:hypothetical protein [Staphylococcus phage S6]|nr:hypothetical protein [Staphylococcus phage S6]